MPVTGANGRGETAQRTLAIAAARLRFGHGVSPHDTASSWRTVLPRGQAQPAPFAAPAGPGTAAWRWGTGGGSMPATVPAAPPRAGLSRVPYPSGSDGLRRLRQSGFAQRQAASSVSMRATSSRPSRTPGGQSLPASQALPSSDSSARCAVSVIFFSRAASTVTV